MNETIQYIKSLFFDIENIEEVDITKFPIYLRDKFEFKNINILGNIFILTQYKSKPTLNVDNIKKDIIQIKKYTNSYPVIVFDSLRLNQREVLIKNKIPFIVPRTQLFIPYPPISLTEIEKREKIISDKFKKSTQVVFAFLLINEIDNINAHRIAEKLGYSVTTANRALNELVDKELIVQKNNGTRKKYIILDKMEYWNRGKLFLFNPISDAFLLMKNKVSLDDSRLYKSGDTALCEYSDNFDENTNLEKHFACGANDFPDLRNDSLPAFIDLSMSNFVAIETLVYNPALLAKDNKIDPVTLYAQYAEKHDERIEIAFDEIIEEIING